MMKLMLTIMLHSSMFHALGRNMMTGAFVIAGTPVHERTARHYKS